MNIARIGNRLVIVSEPVGVAVYDFDFDLYFACDHPVAFGDCEPCVLRIGAIPDYAAAFREKLEWGLRLVNSPEEHSRASELEHWYPLIQDLTPRTLVFDSLPSVREIENSFCWPIFLKGSRQTSKHNPSLAVVKDASQYEAVRKKYSEDEILRWQKPVVREFVPLLPVPGTVAGKIRPSAEFRSFWWNGDCVGWGQYWYQVSAYNCPDVQRGLEVAREAAVRLQVPFLVVDFAKSADGRWIVIECNDAQVSGYTGIVPQVIWNNILRLM
jgi:hypothetical protein